jgi:hypothetical protein
MNSIVFVNSLFNAPGKRTLRVILVSHLDLFQTKTHFSAVGVEATPRHVCHGVFAAVLDPLRRVCGLKSRCNRNIREV